MSGGPDPIEAYLDRLLDALRGKAPDVRRVLAEAEEHLRDAAEDGVREGLAGEDAQRRAVDRFGSPQAVARRFAAETPLNLPRILVGQVVLALLLLGGTGLLAIGASGAVAAGMGSAWGKAFVSGDPPEITYTPERCAYFLEYYPRPTCEEAATAHHYDEVVFYRLAAGILGAVGLAAYWLVRRRARGRVTAAVGVLPDGFVPTVGAAAFGVAGLALLADGLGQLPGGTSAGVGQYLSGAVVSLVVALAFLRSLVRVLSTRAARPALASADRPPS